MRPVDLCLLTGQGAKAQTGLARATRPKLRDAVAEMVGSAELVPRLGHIEQPGGGEGGEALQRPGWGHPAFGLTP